MRLLLASVAAFAAVALAAPSFAQDGAPTPTPSVKPKPGTSAYCNTLKSASSKSACLKRVHASAKAPAGTKAKPKNATKTDTSASLTPPAAPPSPPQTVSVPPLPQKTI